MRNHFFFGTLALVMLLAGVGAAYALHVHAATYQTSPNCGGGFGSYGYHYETGGYNNASWGVCESP